MNRFLLFLCIAMVSCNSSSENETNALDQVSKTSFVDPFIGTGGHGHTYPGATAPFGMVQMSPDSRLEGWDGCGGYHFSDSVIYGFSHTHLQGTGISDYADILFMPTGNQPYFSNSEYSSSFQKSSEFAQPGHYRVVLDEPDVDVNLTCTPRVGIQKYEFLGDGDQWVIIDLFHRDQLLEGNITWTDSLSLEGTRISKEWAQEQHVYFATGFSSPFKDVKLSPGNDSAIQFIALNFGEVDSLIIKTAISAVDIEGAKNNLNEAPHWDFYKYIEDVQTDWENELSRIEVRTESYDDKVKFYTSLYHSFTVPNLYTDLDGRYRGTDLKVHKAEDHTQYTIFSLWDTFRATHPLFSLIQRERTEDFLATFLDHYEKGGQLPVWELAANYTGCMIGYHSVPVITDSYAKGITNFDTKLAMEAMLSIATQDELGKTEFEEYGFIPMDREPESVSKTLEYAYDDWCIAEFGDLINHQWKDSSFLKRQLNYKNIIDSETGFARARRNGNWTNSFDPTEVNFNFTEANSWQYSFFAPHDVEGLIDHVGGEEIFTRQLDSLFGSSSDMSGRHQSDITGLIGQYAHGNEPSHHMAYLYAYSGQPWKTQEIVDEILQDLYTIEPDGLSGNEDCGQMSSWFVFSSMGFYPVCPGSVDYIIGRPLFDEVKINLENGKSFSVITRNNSAANKYVQRLKLNGKELDRLFLNHDEIMTGGELVIEMGSSANRNLASALDQRPKSKVNVPEFVESPIISYPSQTFADSTYVKFIHPHSLKMKVDIVEQEGEVYDHREMTLNSGDSLLITKNATIKVNVENAYGAKSTSRAVMTRLDEVWDISYDIEYNNQYTAGGKNGLIDGIRGGDEFRNGLWQGFWGDDISVIIDLKTPRKVKEISAGFVQDIKPWIWFPKQVKFSVSEDGQTYTPFGTIQNKHRIDDYTVIQKDFGLKKKVGTNARYVRVEAENYGTIPEWHLGEGNQAWIFIDEIIIR